MGVKATFYLLSYHARECERVVILGGRVLGEANTLVKRTGSFLCLFNL